MVWGARNAGIEDLLQRLQANDPKLTSLTLLRQRKFDGLQVRMLQLVEHGLDDGCMCNI
jgi:hypothetical protein